MVYIALQYTACTELLLSLLLSLSSCQRHHCYLCLLHRDALTRLVRDSLRANMQHHEQGKKKLDEKSNTAYLLITLIV